MSESTKIDFFSNLVRFPHDTKREYQNQDYDEPRFITLNLIYFSMILNLILNIMKCKKNLGHVKYRTSIICVCS